MQESILVVDDEKEIADLLEVYLINEGYRVYKFYEVWLCFVKSERNTFFR